MSKLKYRCAAHPDVDSEIHWGCPDCLYQAKREIGDLEERLAEAESAINAVSNLCDDLEVALAAEREELRGLLNRMVTERDIAEQKVERVEALPDKWDVDVRRGTSAKDMGWRGMSIGEGFNACADDLRAALREDTK